MNKEDFLEVLDQYFRRRPPLAAVMWHTELVTGGAYFTIPQGKIYEVYVFFPAGLDFAIDWHAPNMPNDVFAEIFKSANVASSNVMFPCGTYYGTIATLDYGVLSTTSHGFIMSEGEHIGEANSQDMYVRWRDVTDIAPF